VLNLDLILVVEKDGPYHAAEEYRRRDEWFEQARRIKRCGS
jgi:hypothetical protein